PSVIWHNAEKYIKKDKIPPKLNVLLDQIVAADRKVLVFFPDIQLMEQLAAVLKKQYKRIDSVYSKDPARYEKVQQMRNGEIGILRTTTILERGVTFLYLDVIVVNAQDRKSTRLNSSHVSISYAVFCLKK